MENSYDSANWSDCHTSLYNESAPFLVSWALPSGFSDSSSVQFHGFASSSSCDFPMESGGDERHDSASRTHRQAEKRRRDRINSHLVALRKLVPNSDKMDKAALLGRVIEQVKELKQKATEASHLSSLPTEADEVTVHCEGLCHHPTETIDDQEEEMLFRASICCEDRPEVLSEIIRVLKGIKVKTIKADVACVGGRMRSDLVLSNKGCEETSVSASALKQSLSQVLNRITSSSSTSTTCRIRSKRQRWFLSSHYSH